MKSANNYYVTTFYYFKNLKNLELIQQELELQATGFNMTGLIILGPEGFNATVSLNSEEDRKAYQNYIRIFFSVPDLFFKDSESHKAPFRRFKIKIREEIVTAGIPEMSPDTTQNNHLTPAEWNRVLKEEKDILVIDTRNWYETKIGTFKGAVNPKIDKFTEFPDYVEKNPISKDQKMLIFCTGGIRCEKGILELQSQGFNNVYQLDG